MSRYIPAAFSLFPKIVVDSPWQIEIDPKSVSALEEFAITSWNWIILSHPVEERIVSANNPEEFTEVPNTSTD